MLLSDFFNMFCVWVGVGKGWQEALEQECCNKLQSWWGSQKVEKSLCKDPGKGGGEGEDGTSASAMLHWAVVGM